MIGLDLLSFYVLKLADPLWVLPSLLLLLVALVRRHRRKALTWLATYLLAYLVLYQGLASAWVASRVERHYAAQRIPLRQTDVSPSLLPFVWEFAVERADDALYETGHLLVFGAVNPDGRHGYVDDHLTRQLRQLPALQPVFRHFTFPLFDPFPGENGYTVTISDVRYRSWGRALIHYRVTLDRDLNVLMIEQGGALQTPADRP